MKRIVCFCLCLLSPALFAKALEDAEQALNNGRYEEAITHLDRHLSRQPQDANARFHKGLALSMLKRDEEAIKVFADLARDYPELPEPFNNLAVLYARNGQYEEARDALESALVTHPSFATAHENLGDIYAALANAAYNRAVVLDKDNAGIRYKLDVLAQINSLKGSGAPPAQVALNPVTPAAPPSSSQTATQATTQAARPAVSDQSPVRTPVATAAPAAPAQPSSQPVARPAASVPAPIISSTAPVLNTSRSGSSGAAQPQKAADQGAILATVERWRSGWSAQDVEAYLSAYSPNFEPATGISRSDWEAQRRSRVVRPRSISVQVLNPKVFQGTSSYARVEFLQIYESNTYSDQVRKLLELEKLNGRWLIVGESVIN